MASKHPIRLAVFSEDGSYYPRELTESDGILYLINDDGSHTALNKTAATSITNAAGGSIGTINPKTAGTIKIPNASSSVRGLVVFGTTTGKAAGTASAGTSDSVARADHVHPVQTTISGNAGSATKLATARKIGLSGVTATAQEFDGSDDINIPITAVPASIVTGLATVATSGKYSDLDGTPTIPTAGNTTPKADSGSGSAGTATTWSRSDHVHPAQTSVSGNAGTANKLKTARTLSWIGDATGSLSFDGSDDESATLTLAASGVAAGSYGPSSNASPDHSGTFKVPYITVDAKGRVTSASTKTITLPTDSDIKVEQKLLAAGIDVDCPIILGTPDQTAGKIGEVYFHSNLKYNDSTNTISANASSADKLSVAREISITGGATADPVLFDGSSAIALNVSSLDAAKLTGVIPLSCIPKGAQERLIPVENDTARLALTIADAQNGDVIKVESTGIMYYITNDSLLGTEDAFSVFTAGAASSVDWSGITNKPNSFTPSSHNHSASNITSGTLGVARGGTGASSFTSGNVLIGNGTGAITTRAIDVAEGGTKDSTSLITSGAVFAGLAEKANTSHGIHVSFASTIPSASNGSGSAGSATTVSRSDHVHPVQTTISGNAGSATKLATARKIGLSGVTATAQEFDGSKDINIPITAVPASIVTGLATVATSGKYSDLDGTPTIPTLIAGANITLTPDDANDTITITANNTVYTHPTYTNKNSGLYKITVDSTGHVSTATAVTKADITALGIPDSDTNTHYESKNIVGSTASAIEDTTTALTNGNVYLNHIENAVITSSHLIKGSSNATVTTDADGNILISATNTKNTAGSSNTTDKIYLVGAKSQASSATTYSNENVYTQNGALYSEGSKVITESALSSSTVGTATNATTAAKANRLNISGSIGNATKPVYFTEGVPVSCTYTLGSDVPSGALFFTEIDTTPISGSTNPVTSGGIYTALSGKAPTNHSHTNYLDSAASRTKNTVYAAPNGSDGAASFRALVAADIPNLSTSKITSGTLGVARGGIGANSLASGEVLVGNGTNAVTTKAIDATTGGTEDSTSLITSGAVFAGLANKANEDHMHIYYGEVDDTSTSSAYTVTIDGIDELKDGMPIFVKFNVAANAAATLNVNGLGALYLVYNGGPNAIKCCAANSISLLVYDSGAYASGAAAGWQVIYSYDSNTTYTPAKLGYGYGTCSTAAATVAKTVSLSDYILTKGGIVSVKFTYAVPASATLNVNSKGAKAIYNGSSAIKAGVIKAGDTATFIYSGSYYYLIAINSANASTDTEDYASVTTFSNVAVSRSSWTGSEAPYTNTVTISGILASDTPIVELTYLNASDYAGQMSLLEDWSKVYRITTAADSITLYATEKPTNNVVLLLQMKCIR